MKKTMQKFRFRGLLMLAVVLPLTWLGCPQASHAGDLKPEHVPAEAKWVVHMDLDKLMDIKLVQTVRDRRPDVVEYVRQWVQEQYGIDPRSDLNSVTMFSKDYKKYTGSVILQAKYDPQKVEQQLRQGEQLETTKWNDLTLYTFTVAKHRGTPQGQQNAKTRPRAGQQAANHDGHDKSGGKRMTVALLDNETIVFGSSVENAKDVIGLLQGDAPSLKGKDSKLLDDVASDAIMYGAAIQLENISENDIPMPVLKQHEMITWVFGEKDDQLYEEARLVGQSEDVAKKMERVIQGALAYEQLWAADSEPLTKIVEAAEVSRDGQEVKVEWESSTQNVIAGLDDLIGRLEDWRLLSSR